jgi:hypothetical protein
MTTPRPPADSRLETLEREVARLAQVAGRTATREPNQGFPPQIRLAETWSSLPENYPASGNTFDIRFLDGALDVWSPGQRTATYTPRSLTTQTVAHVVDDRWFPRLTRVRVLQQNRKWWILDKVEDHPALHMQVTSPCAGIDPDTGEMSLATVTPMKATDDILATTGGDATLPTEVYNPTWFAWHVPLVVEAWQDHFGDWYGRPIWRPSATASRPYHQFGISGSVPSGTVQVDMALSDGGGIGGLGEINEDDNIFALVPGDYWLEVGLDVQLTVAPGFPFTARSWQVTIGCSHWVTGSGFFTYTHYDAIATTLRMTVIARRPITVVNAGDEITLGAFRQGDNVFYDSDLSVSGYARLEPRFD